MNYYTSSVRGGYHCPSINCLRNRITPLNLGGMMELLQSSSQSEHQVKSRFLLDIVVRKSTTILKLLPCENQSLLIRWNAFLVLDLGLHIRYRVRRLHVKSDCLSRESLHKDLHASSQSKH